MRGRIRRRILLHLFLDSTRGRGRWTALPRGAPAGCNGHTPRQEDLLIRTTTLLPALTLLGLTLAACQPAADAPFDVAAIQTAIDITN